MRIKPEIVLPTPEGYVMMRCTCTTHNILIFGQEYPVMVVNPHLCKAYLYDRQDYIYALASRFYETE